MFKNELTHWYYYGQLPYSRNIKDFRTACGKITNSIDLQCPSCPVCLRLMKEYHENAYDTNEIPKDL